MSEARIIERRQAHVVKLLVEVNTSVYERLMAYVALYGMTKRDLVSEALLVWLNTQDSGRMSKGDTDEG